MKKKYLIPGLLATAVIFGVLGVSVVSAYGFGWFGKFGPNVTPDEIAQMQQQRFQEQAQILGLSVDEVKNAWAEGKTMQQIIEEKGLSQGEIQTRMKETRFQELKNELQTLVEKGVITQTQADKRLQFMEQNQGNWSMPCGSHRRMGPRMFF